MAYVFYKNYICFFLSVLKKSTLRGVVGWERVPTPFCTSSLTWRCGIQKITLKHGCDLTDGLATRRFALLVKSVHTETRGYSVEILVGECSLYSNDLVQFFIWSG